MTKTETLKINELAVLASKEMREFDNLFLAVEHELHIIVESYLIKNNLLGFNFDQADYYSATGQALWECVAGFDSTKGNFMPRLNIFAFKRMKEITDYNLAGKRFNKSQSVISFDELFESEEFDLEDTSTSTDTEKLVYEFIKTDKDSQIIEILMATADTKLRNICFTKLFGQYGATERKKVQRARERLKAHLTSNGVLI